MEGIEGVKEFLVVTNLCQMKRLLYLSLNLVHFELKHLSSNMGYVLKWLQE